MVSRRAGIVLGLRSLLMVVIACLAVAAPASAEWFADLYLGVASTSDADFTTTIAGISVSGTTEFESSFTIGGRAGYWFEGLPWLGLALDVSHFQADEDVERSPLEISVVPLSALLMVRASLLKTSEFPNGQLQPYLGIGPGLFITNAESDLSDVGIPRTFSDTSADLGLDLRAGLAWQFRKNLALFGEYRFTHFKPEFRDNVLGSSVSVEVEANTHHFVAGISYRF